MEGIEQMPLLEEEGEAGRIEGNADETAGGQQPNEHVQDRPNVEMENGKGERGIRLITHMKCASRATQINEN